MLLERCVYLPFYIYSILIHFLFFLLFIFYSLCNFYKRNVKQNVAQYQKG